jgi:dihydroxyacetone kinase-like predicted kinase
MIPNFPQALRAGVERLTAWADILDSINVFPIADGDTGRNLIVSLSPLRLPDRDRAVVAGELLRGARGNSGNIAAAFFSCFIQVASLAELPEAVRLGSRRARQAVADPQPGTMLSFFDELVMTLADPAVLDDLDRIAGAVARLAIAVRATAEQQPKLRRAGVVDAGALGLFLFFEGFLHVFPAGGSSCRLWRQPSALTYTWHRSTMMIRKRAIVWMPSSAGKR